MRELLYGLILFFIAFFFHVAFWRIRKPVHTVKILVVLFTLVIVTGLIILKCMAQVYPELSIFPREMFRYIHIGLFYFSLFIFYLSSYPAVEVDSPSLVIINLISQSGKDGLPIEKIKESLKDDFLVEPRLKDLVDANLVDLIGSIYMINERGVIFVRPFISYRKFLGLGMGG
jgi:hypothetical protein